MTFYVESLNSHEVMPLMKLFEQRRVEKTHKLSSSRGVAEHHKTTEQTVIEQQSKKKTKPTIWNCNTVLPRDRWFAAQCFNFNCE